jgi:hypothetical protein
MRHIKKKTASFAGGFRGFVSVLPAQILSTAFGVRWKNQK